jgi:hypothetical protein
MKESRDKVNLMNQFLGTNDRVGVVEASSVELVTENKVDRADSCRR